MTTTTRTPRPTLPRLSAAARRMLTAVQSGDGVTFPTLMEAFGDGADGELCLYLGSEGALSGNIVLWANVSEAFATAMNQIKPYLETNSVPALIYLMDGCALGLPILTSAPTRPLKRAHWLPVAYSVRPEMRGRVKARIGAG